MNLPERQATNVGIKSTKTRSIIGDTGQVHILFKVACCHLSKSSQGPDSIYCSLSHLLNAAGQHHSRLVEVARASAFEKFVAKHSFLDVPDAVAFP